MSIIYITIVNKSGERMSRKLFEGMGLGEPEPDTNIDYKAPEKKPFDAELIERLTEHYIFRKNSPIGSSSWFRTSFECHVLKLESIIKDAADKVNSQLLIDTLIVKLGEAPDGLYISRTMYLTLVIQALFNLDYTSKFVIDISNWHKNEPYDVGHYLEGKPDKPLVVDLYSNIDSCGDYANHCNFRVYDAVQEGGLRAANSIFDLMPDAEIEWYRASRSKCNTLRRLNEKGEITSILNEKGEVMAIPTLYQRIKLRFKR